MFKTTVSKQSLRVLTGRKRLPDSMLLYITGAMFYDLLKENGMEDAYELMNTTYCMGGRSINRTQYRVSGNFNLRRKIPYDLNKMKKLTEIDPYLNAQFYTVRNTCKDPYRLLFLKYVIGYKKVERKYKSL